MMRKWNFPYRITHGIKELRWQTYTLGELGLSVSQPEIMHRSSKTIGIGTRETGQLKSIFLWDICVIQKQIVLCSGRLNITVPGTGKSAIKMDMYI